MLEQTRRAILVAGALTASPAVAGEGIIEINQACAVQTGCVAGDDAGFPVILTQPGSYQLTGNLTVSGPSHAIQIATNRVTLDLAGFVIEGSGVGLDGISSVDRADVEIRNGTIRGMSDQGIHAFGAQSRGHRLARLRVEGNGAGGISLDGSHHAIRDCVVRANGFRGITVFESASITGVTAQGNAGDGIRAQGGSIIVHSISTGNAQDGIAILEGVVANSTARDNGASGISAGSSRVVDNAVHNNNTTNTLGQGGLGLGRDNLASGNLAQGNQNANVVVTSSDNVLVDNLALDGPGSGFFFFNASGNFWANNRATGNSPNFNNAAGQTDGGGNVAF